MMVLGKDTRCGSLINIVYYDINYTIKINIQEHQNREEFYTTSTIPANNWSVTKNKSVVF